LKANSLLPVPKTHGAMTVDT